MKFLVDENLPSAVVEELRAKGFDAIKAKSGSVDAEIAALAQKEKRVLLTMDKDFANVLNYPPHEYSGIICLKIKSPVLKIVIKMLDSVLNSLDESSVKGNLIVLTPTGYRIRMSKST